MAVEHAKIRFDDQRFRIEGCVDYYNVTALYHQSLALLKEHSLWVFDFSNLKANSAALALMIEWMKVARKQNKTVRFENIPSNLISIAKVAGLDLLIQ